MAVKLSDVAKRAGVSTATVSRIINNQSGYADKTREKVLSVIQELGYSPNALAQGLVHRRTNTIGILLPSLSTRFSSLLIRGIEQGAYSAGFNVMICNTDSNGERTNEYLRMLLEKRVDGIIFASEYLRAEYAAFLKKWELPCALVSTFSPANAFSSVRVDDRKASQDAVAYLISEGHRRIGLISGSKKDQIAGVTRVQGYKDALQAAGLQADEADIAYGDFHFRSGYAAMKELWTRDRGLTAVFATSDEMALGAMAFLHHEGVDIPDRLSIMGYDDTLDAEIAFPTLTTVHQPIGYLGQTAVELVVDAKKGRPSRAVVVEHSITKRNSVRRLA